MILRPLSVLLAAAVLAGSAHSQSPGVTIESSNSLAYSKHLISQAEALKSGGKLLSRERVNELLDKPEAAPVGLVAPSATRMSAQEIVARAKKSFVRIGWFYLCKRCDHWHLNLAGGYAIDDKDAVATCEHCVRTDVEMREGYLIAVDDEEKVYPVTGVLAVSKEMDAAVLRVEGGSFLPLALQDQIVPGDAAYLYSEPFNHAGYFSSGMVNRFYWRSGDEGDATKLADAGRLRLNVSTDWAPGSSGAAVLDAFGNAIGHVSRIETRGNQDKKGEAGNTMIAFREAVTARGVRLLVEEMQKQAAAHQPQPETGATVE